MSYLCIDAYEFPDKEYDWTPCPNCGLRPKIWKFDNGRSTACGCGESKYNHHSIHAECIMSVIKRSDNGKSCTEYNSDELRENWNHWCLTGEIIFEHASKRIDGRW